MKLPQSGKKYMLGKNRTNSSKNSAEVGKKVQ